MKNTRLTYILLFATLLLLLPLIAMQFTSEVNWTASDFVIGGILLYGFSFLLEFVLRRTAQSKNRVILVLAVLFLFVLIWAELAVGIFGTPFAGS